MNLQSWVSAKTEAAQSNISQHWPYIANTCTAARASSPPRPTARLEALAGTSGTSGRPGVPEGMGLTHWSVGTAMPGRVELSASPPPGTTTVEVSAPPWG